jgi:hypothetical protein
MMILFRAKKLILFCSFLLAVLIVKAQPGNPVDPDNPVPLSGIEILLASGALLGAKRFFDFRKKQ